MFASKPMIGDGLHQVEALALGHVLGLRDIDQHDVAQLGRGAPIGAGRAHVARADDRDLRSTHGCAPRAWMAAKSRIWAYLRGVKGRLARGVADRSRWPRCLANTEYSRRHVFEAAHSAAASMMRGRTMAWRETFRDHDRTRRPVRLDAGRLAAAACGQPLCRRSALLAAGRRDHLGQRAKLAVPLVGALAARSGDSGDASPSRRCSSWASGGAARRICTTCWPATSGSRSRITTRCSIRTRS